MCVETCGTPEQALLAAARILRQLVQRGYVAALRMRVADLQG